MKAALPLLLSCVLACSAHAEFRTWTRADGKTAELELLSVNEANGDKQGVFKMRNGSTIKLAASTFIETDARLLNDWKAPEAAEAGGPSVFDKELDGNLIKLDGKSLKPFRDFQKPTKYYLFYYTASWCGPCHKFTPSLVEFYNRLKPASREFEVVLITCDDDDKAMEDYAREKAMPWPQLKLSKTDKFKKEFKHPGTGIPNLVLTDLQGKLLKTSYEGDTYLGPSVVMHHLETLLKK